MQRVLLLGMNSITPLVAQGIKPSLFPTSDLLNALRLHVDIVGQEVEYGTANGVPDEAGGSGVSALCFQIL